MVNINSFPLALGASSKVALNRLNLKLKWIPSPLSTPADVVGEGRGQAVHACQLEVMLQVNPVHQLRVLLAARSPLSPGGPATRRLSALARGGCIAEASLRLAVRCLHSLWCSAV